jgi:hypothetical protein
MSLVRPQHWLFSIKAFLAGMLALAVAFWLDLPRLPIPTKAPVCNGIMPPGDSGMMAPPCNGMIPPGAPRSLTF